MHIFLIQLLKIINISKNKSVFLFPGVHNAFPTVSWLCFFSVFLRSFFISNCQLAIFFVSGNLFTFIFLSLFLSIFLISIQDHLVLARQHTNSNTNFPMTREIFISFSYLDFRSLNSPRVKKIFSDPVFSNRVSFIKKGVNLVS